MAEINSLLYSPNHPRDLLERALRIEALSSGWRGSFEALLQSQTTDAGSGNAGLAPAAAAHPAAPGFRPLAVTAIDQECADVLSLTIRSPDGEPLPGEYVAGWLKRGPTGVIGTNKSDAAETVRSLLADLAGGPGPGDVQLPRAGLLPMPEVAGAGDVDGSRSRLAAVLAERGVRPVSYADWLKIETAEKDLAASLGRGARVKLASRDELNKACGA